MSSLSLRFSALSAGNKSYTPPKPTFHSPQLKASRHTSLLPSSSATVPLRASQTLADRPRTAPNQNKPSGLRSVSEFGSVDLDALEESAESEAEPHTSWLELEEDVAPSASRRRSSTLSSGIEYVHTPNPIKSQFDDSDDEDQPLSTRLSTVPQFARLAALGSTRLFRRHVRASSSIDLGHKRAAPSVGAPRKAVVGDRPSATELEHVKPAPSALERDLVRSLKGSSAKDRNKALPRPPERLRRSRDSTTTIDGPPPAYVEEAGLRKSRSLTTLRLEQRGVESLERIAEDLVSPLPPSMALPVLPPIERSRAFSLSEIKRTGLPPQKPPPKAQLPPTPRDSGSQSFESAKSNPTSPTALTTWSILDAYAHSSLPLTPHTWQADAKVELNVGGTRFTTLASTLRGEEGDCPRLLLPHPIGRSRQKSQADLEERADETDAAGSSHSSSPSTFACDLSQTDSVSTRRTSGVSEPHHDPQAPVIFVDRDPELYTDILDMLRSSKLPFRLHAASLAAPCGQQHGCPLVALRMTLRCRLTELAHEAEWLGYQSISLLCKHQLNLL
ncbi:hypothetical protein PANT_3c00029 [Moesziomyces antarcticus T-34]|uniref:BTB domain-containing protein n=1 Tax=Pseudozyma antarctica (strain T-34) TaxID=1151754 RepID=M9LSV5_PSEA3|nr:hypothetical protein PANT_3c00029 [Moesziomyces antarcticus T-34]